MDSLTISTRLCNVIVANDVTVLRIALRIVFRPRERRDLNGVPQVAATVVTRSALECTNIINNSGSSESIISCKRMSSSVLCILVICVQIVDGSFPLNRFVVVRT